MPDLLFRDAGPADVAVIGSLADRIWRASYADMLTAAQIEHMLGWMYAPGAILGEMGRGVTWQLAELNGTAVGYLSLSFGQGGVADLHKLYLAPELQGRGLGQVMLAQAKMLASRAGAAEVRLRVNKHNGRALRSYAGAGFIKVGEVVSDIGGGFVMDDFVLAMRLDPLPAPLVKVCGLSTADTMDAALQAGADQVGLVFFPRSPRHVAMSDARTLAAQARGRAEIVALTVDADAALLDAIDAAVRPDWLQMHGRESPAQVDRARSSGGRRVMKAIGIGSRSDVDAAAAYRGIADRILFDARPPDGATRPGGNGQPFDWTILSGAPSGYMLSGGLNPGNVREALRVTGATAVDVSSGVETAPGRKDVDRIAAFVRAAKAGVGGRDLAVSDG